MFIVKNRDDLIKSCLDFLDKDDIQRFSDKLCANPSLRPSTVATYAGKTFLELILERRRHSVKSQAKNKKFFNALLNQSENIKPSDFLSIFEEFSVEDEDLSEIKSFFKVHRDKIKKSLKDDNYFFILNGALNFNSDKWNFVLGSDYHMYCLNGIVSAIKNGMENSEDELLNIFKDKVKINKNDGTNHDFSIHSFLSNFTHKNNIQFFLEFCIDNKLKFTSSDNEIVLKELDKIYTFSSPFDDNTNEKDPFAFTSRMNKFYKHVIKEGLKDELNKELKEITVKTGKDIFEVQTTYTNATKKWLLTYPEIMMIDDEVNKSDLSDLDLPNECPQLKVNRIQFLLLNVNNLKISDDHLLSTIKYLHDAKDIDLDFPLELFENSLHSNFLDEVLGAVIKNKGLFGYLLKNLDDKNILNYKMLTYIIENSLSDEFDIMLNSKNIEEIFDLHQKGTRYKNINEYIKQIAHNCKEEDGKKSIAKIIDNVSLDGDPSKLNGIEKIMLTKEVFDASVAISNESQSRKVSFKI